MSNVEMEIANFMNKCDDLISSKFILANKKITELLKSISASKVLCNLFRQVTEEFSYARAKEVYIAATPDGSINRKVILLPEDVYEQIAFVFCLLVDFDCGNIDFNQFLREYFNVDGSFTESYTAFVNQLIKPFKNSVRQALKSKNIAITPSASKTDERNNLLKELRVCVVRLKKTIGKIVDDDDSKFGMSVILSVMLDCLAKDDYKTFKALVIGYSFGEHYAGVATDDLKRICEIMGRLKI